MFFFPSILDTYHFTTHRKLNINQQNKSEELQNLLLIKVFSFSFGKIKSKIEVEAELIPLP